ncbi:helix-turn-helix domain-containing protein [Streptomyces sp. NPDC046805]|uniref:PucR family transcriptional regulator n=1 Tax=Streptomyces sp. NPDC046805 TaxID=3155134 RepID=UPI00340B975A
MAASMLAEVDDLADAVLASVTAQLPELAADPRTAEVFTSTVFDNVVTALRALSVGAPAEGSPTPPVALEFARRLAQQAVSITTMLRAYRIGQEVFQQHVMTQVAKFSLAAEEVAETAMALSAFAFSFIDQVSEQVVNAYVLERDSWLRHRNAVRLARVRALLDGRISDPQELEAVAGFPADMPMVALIIWHERNSGNSNHLGSLEQHLGQLASSMEISPRATLSVAPDESTLWAWMPCSGLNPTAMAERMGKAAEGVLATAGNPGLGVAGFRTSHRQARQAQAIALIADRDRLPPFLATSELGPLALLGTDPGDLKPWVESVLGRLATDDDHNARLRETVYVYLSTGNSLNSAATELHLHKNTIQYRIRKAEEARGRPLSDGRIDVEVALFACRLLGSPVLRSAP